MLEGSNVGARARRSDSGGCCSTATERYPSEGPDPEPRATANGALSTTPGLQPPPNARDSEADVRLRAQGGGIDALGPRSAAPGSGVARNLDGPLAAAASAPAPGRGALAGPGGGMRSVPLGFESEPQSPAARAEGQEPEPLPEAPAPQPWADAEAAAVSAAIRRAADCLRLQGERTAAAMQTAERLAARLGDLSALVGAGRPQAREAPMHPRAPGAEGDKEEHRERERDRAEARAAEAEARAAEVEDRCLAAEGDAEEARRGRQEAERAAQAEAARRQEAEQEAEEARRGWREAEDERDEAQRALEAAEAAAEAAEARALNERRDRERAEDRAETAEALCREAEVLQAAKEEECAELRATVEELGEQVEALEEGKAATRAEAAAERQRAAAVEAAVAEYSRELFGEGWYWDPAANQGPLAAVLLERGGTLPPGWAVRPRAEGSRLHKADCGSGMALAQVRFYHYEGRRALEALCGQTGWEQCVGNCRGRFSKEFAEGA
ncbi:hypothetical protein HYH03_009168 [Edaphochlamys debaryana]|uniref:Uncharacterized protein n=1 Tax=Edaphochlamys debaryana TaxID=47281 RepID=A0A835Y0Q4_9CHLO|nr:hypothetical protein HYH03_009168 [Edaphochlamys debaryana]|eukprot:KAG2492503.1 hypothetical protein HYH03_009168 [Edaphochlamys debaryana]